MNYRELRPVKAAIFFCCFVFLVFACRKPDNGIGGEILPEDDILNLFFTDTISVIAFNSNEPDSVRTSAVATGLIGSYIDPTVGQHSSEMYFQLRLPASNVSFEQDAGTSLKLDSVVLSLDYTGTFIGELNPMTFEVFQIAEDLFLDSIYYSNSTFETLPENLVDPERAEITPSPSLPTILLDSAMVENRLRIHLDTAWASMFLDPINTVNLETSDSFTEWFKGLHVRTETGDGAILNVDLTAFISSLDLHYQTISPDTTVNNTFSFLINDNSQRVNHFNHDYSTSVVDYYLNDSVLGQQRLFIQAAAGESVELDFPFIDAWKDSTNIAINNAELVFPIEDVKSGFLLPPRIFAVRFDEEGEEASTPDQFQGDSHIDGFLDLEDQEYRVNITRYLQQVITGEIENRGLRIRPSFNASSFNSVSIFGFENPEKRAKLVFTYTKF